VTSVEDVSDKNKALNVSVVSNVTSSIKPTPQWKEDLLSGKYYGSQQYVQRKLYTNNPNKGKLWVIEQNMSFNNYSYVCLKV